MATFGAYALRRAEGAESFRAAWKQALDMGAQRLADIAMERAIEGVPVPIMYHGEQVGERRHYNDRLLTFMLQHHQPRHLWRQRRRCAPASARRRLDEVEGEDDARRNISSGMDAHPAAPDPQPPPAARGASADDPAKRAAWETLVGPVDWDKAERLEAQADEPFGDPGEGGGGNGRCAAPTC